ncbi:MAG TPA: cytochrome c [Candidatus Eisenbacteria bacterium]|nr:cytochrome c [Candidatus Eisenbacteria bacterium]
MSSFKRSALVALALVLAVPLLAFAQGSGADTFKAKCAMCHGPDGNASTGMGKSMGLKPLSSPEVQKMSDADLTALVSNGKGKMPAYKGKLSDADITAVVKYVKTLK